MISKHTRKISGMFFYMLKLLSPAKLNLFLKIVKKRPDGYHELESLFQTISLVDNITFSLSDRDELTCSNPHIPTDANNLVIKALNLFRAKTKLNFNVKIHLEKNIPSEAGLGGGSGNAATTLWGINTLLNNPCLPSDLLEFSKEIGSDVAFFLSNGTAFCSGRGEVVLPMPALPFKNLWVIKPMEGLSTPLVYKNLKVDSLPKRDIQTILKEFYRGKDEYFNDLEDSAFELMPSLKTLKNNLILQGFQKVILAGSGSSLFCLGNVNAVQLEGISAYPVHFLNRKSNEWYSL